MSIVSLQNVCVSYAKRQILTDVSFSLWSGEVFACLGQNGAGKTTTLKTMLGILTPQSGEVSLFQQSPRSRDVQRRIGLLPEHTYFYKYLTGEEFLDFCASFYGIPPAELAARKDYLFHRVHLQDHRHKRLSTYSKWMLQRIGIAQTMIHHPDVIFLDEPMSGLDPLGRRLIKDIIREMKAEGRTVFLNTHILSDVEEICDRCMIIDHGRVVLESSVSDLSEPLEELFTRLVSGEIA